MVAACGRFAIDPCGRLLENHHRKSVRRGIPGIVLSNFSNFGNGQRNEGGFRRLFFEFGKFKEEEKLSRPFLSGKDRDNGFKLIAFGFR